MTKVNVRRITDPTDDELQQMASMLTEAGLKGNNTITYYAVSRDPELLKEWYYCSIAGTSIGAHQYAAYLDGSDEIVGVVSAYAPGVEMMGDDTQRSRGFFEFMQRVPERNKKWYAEFGPIYMAMADEGVGIGVRKASWNVNSLCVAPAHRGKGIAKALMGVIEDLARADRTQIVLDVDKESNTSFYKHLEYEVVASHEMHDFDGKPERTMVLFRKSFA